MPPGKVPDRQALPRFTRFAGSAGLSLVLICEHESAALTLGARKPQDELEDDVQMLHEKTARTRAIQPLVSQRTRSVPDSEDDEGAHETYECGFESIAEK